MKEHAIHKLEESRVKAAEKSDIHRIEQFALSHQLEMNQIRRIRFNLMERVNTFEAEMPKSF